MNYDLTIRNAHIIDPANQKDEYGMVCVKNRKIVPGPDGPYTSGREIDAQGAYVFPGLIDFHTHLAYGMSYNGILPDLSMIPNGVTAAVDQGSVGGAAFPALVRQIIDHSLITMRAFLHVNPDGLSHHPLQENTDPGFYSSELIQEMKDRFPEVVAGLKVRIGQKVTDRGLEPLKAAKALARRHGLRLCVHIVTPEQPYSEILPLLDFGDIVAHCFQGGPKYRILDENDRVRHEVLEARKRGILFDVAAGRANHSLEVCRRAVEQGFYPDLIGTDLVSHSLYSTALFSLPRLLSIFYALGMPLEELIRACTQMPAKVLGLEGKIGSLSPGSKADISVFKLEDTHVRMADEANYGIPVKKLFVPQMTIVDGKCLYRQITFGNWNFREERGDERDPKSDAAAD